MVDERKRLEVARLPCRLEAESREALDDQRARFQPTGRAGAPSLERGRCEQPDIGHQLVAIDVMPDGVARCDRGRLARDGALFEPASGDDIRKQQGDGPERNEPTGSHSVSLA